MTKLEESHALKEIQKAMPGISPDECVALMDEMKWIEELRILLPFSAEKAGKHLKKILDIKNANIKTKT